LIDYQTNGKKYQQRRASILLLNGEGYTVTEISKRLNTHHNSVRKWINAFNNNGLTMLSHQNKGKKPREKFTKKTKQKIVSIALSKPRELGKKFTTWSLSTLKSYLLETNVLPSISIEYIRKILLEAEISFKKTKAWLHSEDPEYQAKKEVIESLYNNPPQDGVVLCFDEKGTITAKEYQGKSWSKEQIKARMHYKIRGKTALYQIYFLICE